MGDRWNQVKFNTNFETKPVNIVRKANLFVNVKKSKPVKPVKNVIPVNKVKKVKLTENLKEVKSSISRKKFKLVKEEKLEQVLKSVYC